MTTDDVITIKTQRNDAECGICGDVTEMRWGIPTYNGDVVSNEFPEWLHQNGGGSFPVCQHCFDKHERGEIRTYDKFYVPDTLMGVHLTHGAGI